MSLARADGLTILGQLGTGVFVQIGVDLTIRAGADALGRARVYAPFPVVGGSSISHYDTVASRNLLMEPAINPDLTHDVKAPSDLTYELLRDFGWYPDADGDLVNDDVDCNSTVGFADDDRDRRHRHRSHEPLVHERMHERRPDRRPPLGASNHGTFVSGVAHLTNDWAQSGLITGQEKGKVQSAAAKSK